MIDLREELYCLFMHELTLWWIGLSFQECMEESLQTCYIVVEEKDL